MPALPTLAVWSLALVASAAPDKGGGAIEEAKKALETARANLAKAVERIEKDPPAAGDLDLARDAVAALKQTIEAGTELEPKDLDYAKAALAARKELRKQREYVEQRRASVGVHESWRQLDRALESLNGAARRLDDPKAGPK